MKLTEGTVLLNGVAVSEAAAIEFNSPPVAEWEPGALRAVEDLRVLAAVRDQAPLHTLRLASLLRLRRQERSIPGPHPRLSSCRGAGVQPSLISFRPQRALADSAAHRPGPASPSSLSDTSPTCSYLEGQP